MTEKTISYEGVVALVQALGVPLTVFDLETTTFRGRQNFGITECACFSVTLSGTGLLYGHLINPENAIDARVASITGISSSMVRNKETWGLRYAGLFQTLARDHWVGGFNIKTFDCPAVLEMNERYGLPIENGFPRILDVRNLYLELEKPKSKKGKLVEIAEFYSVYPQGNLHRAEADVILTLETLNAMVLGYGVSEIITALSPSKAPKACTKEPVGTVSVPSRPKANTALVELACSGKVKDMGELATALGIELRTASFELGKAVDDRLVNPLPFVNEVTLDWLRTMLVEVPTETLAEGKLKPIYAFLSERQPATVLLDYLQLRIAMLDCGLNWTTLKSQ